MTNVHRTSWICRNIFHIKGKIWSVPEYGAFVCGPERLGDGVVAAAPDEDVAAAVPRHQVPTGGEGQAGEVLRPVPRVQHAWPQQLSIILQQRKAAQTCFAGDCVVGGVNLPEVDMALPGGDDAAVLLGVELGRQHSLAAALGLQLAGGALPVPDHQPVLRAVLHRDKETAPVRPNIGALQSEPGNKREYFYHPNEKEKIYQK